MQRSPKAEATRTALLDAAEACFAEHGFRGASTRSISARAGVTQPLLAHYFGSKDALFDCVLDRCVADFGHTQAPQFALEPGDLRFFAVGLRVLFEWGLARPQLVRLFAWARLEGRLRANEASALMHRQVVDRIADAQRLGVVRADVDVEAALLTVDVAFKGYWDRRESYADTPAVAMGTLTEQDQRYLHATLAMVLRGLLEPGHHAAALALM